jgi:hypothetical protein
MGEMAYNFLQALGMFYIILSIVCLDKHWRLLKAGASIPRYREPLGVALPVSGLILFALGLCLEKKRDTNLHIIKNLTLMTLYRSQKRKMFKVGASNSFFCSNVCVEP